MKNSFIIVVILLLICLVSCYGAKDNLSEITQSPNLAGEVTIRATPTSDDNIILDSNQTKIKTPKYISTVAVKTIKTELRKGYSFGMFFQFRTGGALKVSNLNNYEFAVDEKDFLKTLKEIDREIHETDIWLADIDNDGSEEIAISQYQGGTMGIVYFGVFKKNAYGKYRETVAFDYEQGITFNKLDNLNIVSINGKNYLLVENRDFEAETFSGVTIYAFKKGKFVESAEFDYYSKSSFSIGESSYTKTYKPYIKAINIKKVISVVEKHGIYKGSAEKMKDGANDSLADINNDGMIETIVKKHWNETTNYYAPSFFEFDILDANSKYENGILERVTGATWDANRTDKILQQFWCDKANGKTLIDVLYRNRFAATYYLDVYLFDNDKSLKIGHVKAVPEVNIGVEYFKIAL